MGEISRRTAITAAAVAVAPIVAAAGRGLEDWFDWFPFFGDEPAGPSSQDATQPTAESSTHALSATEAVRSYGPNGTHWPASTPRPGDSGVRVVDVGCSWGAIASAISGASDADVAGGLHVRVAPGSLPGHGAGANARPTLKGLGKASWTRNILVSPRDGWGSVTIADPVRIVGVDGVTFARIDSRYVLLTDCVRTVWAQAKVSQGLKITASARNVTACDLYEVVMADAKIDPNDPFSFAAGAGASLRDCVWEGCYIAPVFRELGSSNHIDAAQMSGGGVYRGLTIRDSTFFGALNCALQLGGPKASDPNKGTPYVTLDRVVLTSQTTALRVRYTLPAGAYQPTIGQAINGSGEPGQLFAKDSYVFGSMYDTKWGSVERSFASFDRAAERNTAVSGGWQVDSTMNGWGAAEFDELTPAPTDDHLRSIWR